MTTTSKYEAGGHYCTKTYTLSAPGVAHLVLTYGFPGAASSATLDLRRWPLAAAEVVMGETPELCAQLAHEDGGCSRPPLEPPP